MSQARNLEKDVSSSKAYFKGENELRINSNIDETKFNEMTDSDANFFGTRFILNLSLILKLILKKQMKVISQIEIISNNTKTSKQFQYKIIQKSLQEKI